MKAGAEMLGIEAKLAEESVVDPEVIDDVRVPICRSAST